LGEQESRLGERIDEGIKKKKDSGGVPGAENPGRGKSEWEVGV